MMTFLVKVQYRRLFNFKNGKKPPMVDQLGLFGHNPDHGDKKTGRSKMFSVKIE